MQLQNDQQQAPELPAPLSTEQLLAIKGGTGTATNGIIGATDMIST